MFVKVLQVYFLLWFAVCVNARSVHGSKTLVVYDERLTQIREFSSMFEPLEQRSYEIEYMPIGNETSAISLYDGEARLYDNLIIFPVKGKNLNRKLSAKELLSFYNDEGDILAITSPEGVAESLRVFLNELGIYPSPKDEKLVDHFQSAPNKHNISTCKLKNKFMFNSAAEDILVFENSSTALLDNREQVIPILAAPRTSFTHGKSNEHWSTGSQGFLLAGFQSLKNSRVGWVGSTQFLKNENEHQNGKFIQEFLKWNFREKNVIKISQSSHSHADGTTYEVSPYKIKDPVKYEVAVSEWDGEKWIPFLTEDLQFELKMIDPYYRLPLIASKNDDENQYYTTGEFRLPDHHGVFTFQVEYKRSGMSFIATSDVKAIRHLAHDEYTRSWDISNSRVYVTSIFALVFVWIVFVISFISAASAAKSITSAKKTN